MKENVRQTLEMLANAGIKVWMLTGDKIETAKCIAISAKLVSRNQNIFQFSVVTESEAAQQLQAFSFLRYGWNKLLNSLGDTHKILFLFVV